MTLSAPSNAATVPAGSPQPTLPNLIIIGAMKAGTSSLHVYLAQHPQIFMSKNKELNFFNEMERGIDWYKSNFDARFKINGESTPRYSRFPKMPGVPKRIKDTLGTPKLILMVRDPVDRLISHYTDVVARGWETRPFAEVLANIDKGGEDYLARSAYYFQLQQYFPHFPREAISIHLLERLSANPKETLRQIFRFLEVDEEFWSPEFDARVNISEVKQPPAPWFERIAPGFLRAQWVYPTWMPWKLALAMRWVSRIGAQQVRKPKLSRDDDLYLQKLLKPDVDALKAYLGDPLPEWRPYA